MGAAIGSFSYSIAVVVAQIMDMNLLVASVLIISLWLILLGAGTVLGPTVTLIFGITAAICAILSTGVIR